MKILVYKYFLLAFNSRDTLYFVYGRQLFTTIDNFVLGMYVGSLVYNTEKRISLVKGTFSLIVILCFLVLWGELGLRYGVYVANVIGYLWHSVLAVILAGIVCTFGFMWEIKGMRFVRFIGINEYGIYLLHFPILQNLLQSPFIQQMNMQGHYLIGCLGFLCMAIIVGIVFNCLIDIFAKTKVVSHFNS